MLTPSQIIAVKVKHCVWFATCSIHSESSKALRKESSESDEVALGAQALSSFLNAAFTCRVSAKSTGTSSQFRDESNLRPCQNKRTHLASEPESISQESNKDEWKCKAAWLYFMNKQYIYYMQTSAKTHTYQNKKGQTCKSLVKVQFKPPCLWLTVQHNKQICITAWKDDCELWLWCTT